MQLKLQRVLTSAKGSEGILQVDTVLRFYTLEPPEGLKDSRGITAIPAGVYKVQLNWSPKFKRNMPEVMAVPDREGIRIHWGNYEVCTDGCILVGNARDTRGDVWASRPAFTVLYRAMNCAELAGEDIELEILPAPPAKVGV